MKRSGNRHPNFSRVDLNFVQVWYSYDTMIAFQYDGGALVVIQNYWGCTTGKHLNCVDGGGRNKDVKKQRVDEDEFDRLWNNGKGPPPEEPEITPAVKGRRDLVRR